MDAASKDKILPDIPIEEMKTTPSTPSTSRSMAPIQGSEFKTPEPEISTSMSPTIVPTAKRRGLLGHLTIIPELESSREYSRSIKWLITFTVSAGAAVITTVGFQTPFLSEQNVEY